MSSALPPAIEAASPTINRRSWLRRAAVGSGALAAGILIDTFFIEPHWLEIVERDLPIRHLPDHWAGKRLAQLSDIHVGHRVSDAYVLESFRRVAEYRPEIVVVTGDYVCCTPRDGRIPITQAARVYEHLPRGSRATLGILGNHDYGPGWNSAAAADQVTGVLTDCGLTMLRNSAIDVDGLTIVGLDDLWAGQCDGAAAFAGTDPAAARLALCHNPDGADGNHWPGYEGWILCGHTHGGQCKPPFLPPPQLPVRNRRYTAGEFALARNRRMYINRGLGHLLPVRFNCRPEVTVFRLTPA